MGIKIKHIDPKSTDFSPNDIVINIKGGSMFYKTSNNDLYKVQGDNLETPDIDESGAMLVTYPWSFTKNFGAQQDQYQMVFIPIISGYTSVVPGHNRILNPPYSGKVKRMSVTYIRESWNEKTIENFTIGVRSAGKGVLPEYDKDVNGPSNESAPAHNHFHLTQELATNSDYYPSSPVIDVSETTFSNVELGDMHHHDFNFSFTDQNTLSFTLSLDSTNQRPTFTPQFIGNVVIEYKTS